ncbi:MULTISPECIES: PP2C family serine/threonine-protein phosphatase [Fictibacillus]|uniref:PP2C family serine/threonine-protein phosphatase n=1 Tax=Fictibacillus terranigra TaxID=3058424 RepID=A0ABT8EDZ4_9BACL|nr:PP2C family serine/threonine-protein phosphatase [Fictibacillus sp. CENA-BCM004]MDN4076139.1 PP2C family serine/threonine-protein phosphatase [Fictibacillus sp. CENA-BCM004]
MIQDYSYDKIAVSSFQKPKNGNDLCGDSFYVTETRDYFICAVADGLGSGSMAKMASQAAVTAVEQNHQLDVESLMQVCNEELRGTRGAVLSIFKIDFQQRTVYYAGIGNIRFMMAGKDRKLIYPLPTVGFLSGKPQKFRIQQFPFDDQTAFIIYSDGMEIHTQSRIILTNMVSPKESAAYLGNLSQKLIDDATCLVGKVSHA